LGRGRQSHEALIHRTDAKLATGVTMTRPDASLTADRVDELIRGFLVGVPEWARWTPDATTVALECTDVGDRDVLELGRMTGTSPASGRSYDLDAAEVRDDPSLLSHTEVSGDAQDMDRWLWGRGNAAALSPTDTREVVTQFHALVAEATQLLRSDGNDRLCGVTLVAGLPQADRPAGNKRPDWS
jgi:hypothetical protein